MAHLAARKQAMTLAADWALSLPERNAAAALQSFKAPPPAGTAAEPFPDLTEREREVLRLLTEGCLYKEIADQMGLSWHTVHSHIRHIYEKLQVRSRSQAVAKTRGRKG